MIFTPTPLAGALIVDADLKRDDRGFFARTYCPREFRAQGVELPVAQCNVSYNEKRGTLRGMHYQADPAPEAKLVRCTAGAIFDVIIDLRPGSPTRCRWFGVELTAENHRALYVPVGFAHGFQTLADRSEVFYLMSEFFAADAARGVRYNDTAFGVAWPLPVASISERDRNYPDFTP